MIRKGTPATKFNPVLPRFRAMPKKPTPQVLLQHQADHNCEKGKYFAAGSHWIEIVIVNGSQGSDRPTMSYEKLK